MSPRGAVLVIGLAGTAVAAVIAYLFLLEAGSAVDPTVAARKDSGKKPSRKGLAAEELSSAYRNDKAAADAKYKEQLLEIEGTFSAVGEQRYGKDKGLLELTFQTPEGNKAPPVLCFFPPENQEKLKELIKGQQIWVRGRIAGQPDSYVEVREAQLVEVGPDPSIRVTASTLTQDFVQNEPFARSVYVNNYLLIDGVVASVDGKKLYLVGYDGPTKDASRVEIVLPSAAAATLQQGQKVVVRGECVGKISNVVLIEGATRVMKQ